MIADYPNQPQGNALKNSGLVTKRQIQAIENALIQIGRVELTLEKDGSVTVRTVTRKRVKV